MEFALVERAVGSVSPRPDGERVAVVGENRPLSPDLMAFVAFEAAAVHPVAAFEVTDPALGACSVAPQAAGGAFGGGFLAASDEHLLGHQVLERAVGRAGHEPTVERDFPRGGAQALQLGGGGGQQRVLGATAHSA